MAAPQAWALKGRHAASFGALMLQALMLALLVAFAGYLTFNLVGNLGASSIHTGFGFLRSTAGFDVGESSSPMMGARAMARRCSSAS